MKHSSRINEKMLIVKETQDTPNKRNTKKKSTEIPFSPVISIKSLLRHGAGSEGGNHMRGPPFLQDVIWSNFYSRKSGNA